MEAINNISTPSLSKFNPKAVPYQYDVIKLVKKEYNYNLGPLEIMLSGSVGSAKSILMAHLAVVHCLQNDGARFLLGRKAMPDLRDTLIQKVIEHIDPDMREGKDYKYNATRGSFKFSNGSEIISRSWHDKRYSKLRSLELSAAAVEELTENDNDQKQFYTELRARVGRLPHVKETFIISATNPDDPDHWAYDYFIRGCETNERIHVFYSKTEDNPFLPHWYINSLKETYDSKMIQRLLEGQWIYIDTSGRIYYEYDSKKHFILENYEVNDRLPIHVTHDFNIGRGKPMSCALFQFVDNKFIFFDEVVIEGVKTVSVYDELAGRGYFDLKHNPKIIVHGDAHGRHNDTRSNLSDYEIIEQFLANHIRSDGYGLDYEIQVPLSNPSIRDRHNLVNGQLCNSKGRVSILIDKRCKTIDEGLRKTKLKEGSSYIEDDSAKHPYQHITTAIGYGIWSVIKDAPINEPIILR